VEGRYRSDQVDDKPVGSIHSRADVTIASRFECRAADNLLCKVEERDTFNPSGHEPERRLSL
jgi:hypothetical protein